MAPPVATLGSVWLPLPFIIMGGFSLLGGILVFLILPETLGRCPCFYSVVDLVVCFIVWDDDVVCAFNIVLILSKLPDTMEEAVNLGKKKKVAIEKQGRINRGMEDEEAPQS